MDTHFAPAGRADTPELQRQIELVSNHALVDGLLSFVAGLFAVINAQRQVVALNRELLDKLEIGDGQASLGLRLGEALDCAHGREPPDGCGTTEFCSTCGAAIAIVTAQAHQQVCERKCSLTIHKNGRQEDLYLSVHACPVDIEGQSFVLLFLRDITRMQQWAFMERIFFHDVSNVMHGLLAAAELHAADSAAGGLPEIILQLATQLASEIEVQRSLLVSPYATLQPGKRTVDITRLLEQLCATFSTSPLAAGKTLAVEPPRAALTVSTDPHLVTRVLTNMVTNALEATVVGDTVRVWSESDAVSVCFCVHNPTPIEPAVARRIFQRNFSTKQKLGRGLGTFSMKVIGEKLLNGTVDFTSTEQGGTTFRFRLSRP